MHIAICKFCCKYFSALSGQLNPVLIIHAFHSRSYAYMSLSFLKLVEVL